ncbi:MAG TPA: hypothetical protein VHO03_07530 [Ignavibacteriales bacterium]|nr:hypothetical protein [Ignavibacteriales bacterium]
MDLDELNRYAMEYTDSLNNTPLDDFDGLSPIQMDHLLYSPFEGGAVINFTQDAENGIFEGSPVFLIARDILTYLSENNGVRLTATGNLPLKLVKEIYDKGRFPNEFIDKGYAKLRSESDWWILHVVKLLLTIAGLARKSGGKFLITKKASKFLADNSEYKLFYELIRAYCLKFRWGYNDGYTSDEVGQVGYMYLLYLLKKYGKNFREAPFYEKMYFRAFPMIQTNSTPSYSDPETHRMKCLEIRFFDRFCGWFGLADIEEEFYERYNRKIKVKRSPLFERIII